MLVLTREVEQSVTVGEATVTIFSVNQRGTVRLGIEAPADIVISRDNIRDIRPNTQAKKNRIILASILRKLSDTQVCELLDVLNAAPLLNGLGDK